MISNLRAPDRFDDHLVASNLLTEILQRESVLMTTKWFDYRFIHPVSATQLFAEAYTKIFREFWRRHFDMEEADKKNPLANYATRPGLFSSVWQARQAADYAGMPYDLFCRYGMDWALERGYRKLPLPNQLMNEEAIVEARKRWNEFAKARLHFAEDEHYLLRNWCDHPAQRDHADWLVKQASLRANPQYVLGTALYQRPMLSESIARAFFRKREHVVDKAREVARAPDELPPPRELDFRPGCFGVPHTFEKGGAGCAKCPSAGECEWEQNAVLERIIETNGSATPAEDRKRELNRERQRRKRKKDKALEVPLSENTPNVTGVAA